MNAASAAEEAAVQSISASAAVAAPAPSPLAGNGAPPEAQPRLPQPCPRPVYSGPPACLGACALAPRLYEAPDALLASISDVEAAASGRAATGAARRPPGVSKFRNDCAIQADHTEAPGRSSSGVHRDLGAMCSTDPSGRAADAVLRGLRGVDCEASVGRISTHVVGAATAPVGALDETAEAAPQPNTHAAPAYHHGGPAAPSRAGPVLRASCATDVSVSLELGGGASGASPPLGPILSGNGRSSSLNQVPLIQHAASLQHRGGLGQVTALVGRVRSYILSGRHRKAKGGGGAGGGVGGLLSGPRPHLQRPGSHCGVATVAAATPAHMTATLLPEYLPCTQSPAGLPTAASPLASLLTGLGPGPPGGRAQPPEPPLTRLPAGAAPASSLQLSYQSMGALSVGGSPWLLSSTLPATAEHSPAGSQLGCPYQPSRGQGGVDPSHVVDVDGGQGEGAADCGGERDGDEACCHHTSRWMLRPGIESGVCPLAAALQGPVVAPPPLPPLQHCIILPATAAVAAAAALGTRTGAVGPGSVGAAPASGLCSGDLPPAPHPCSPAPTAVEASSRLTPTSRLTIAIMQQQQQQEQEPRLQRGRGEGKGDAGGERQLGPLQDPNTATAVATAASLPDPGSWAPVGRRAVAPVSVLHDPAAGIAAGGSNGQHAYSMGRFSPTPSSHPHAGAAAAAVPAAAHHERASWAIGGGSTGSGGAAFLAQATCISGGSGAGGGRGLVCGSGASDSSPQRASPWTRLPNAPPTTASGAAAHTGGGGGSGCNGGGSGGGAAAAVGPNACVTGMRRGSSLGQAAAPTGLVFRNGSPLAAGALTSDAATVGSRASSVFGMSSIVTDATTAQGPFAAAGSSAAVLVMPGLGALDDRRVL
ncbi:hypothetical protein GPECTOR_55g331 [Gonium pectorale]|uniref:Uncharacterized protein n=1 Tax=Gonium pectorale TaxID=33097 RepID=A0A150G7A4_GONPE|nr:hypothetical protein GPECTOR_55g331 [Gonium pectorale]|eukprot:KXZ45425.1 hypothetical protein GPECTOR_55g331 [Gonium pectorale]